MNYVDQVKSIAKNNKYTKWYCNIVQNAQKRASSKKEARSIGLMYTESHHILPKSFGMGGEKDKLNYAYLTAKEHLICHIRLLPKMFDGVLKKKMCGAAFSMIRVERRNKKIKLTLRQRTLIRELYAEGRKIGSKYARQNKNRIYNEDGTYTMSQEVRDGHMTRQAKKVADGNHNMLTDEFQKKAREAQSRMFEAGTHPFQNSRGSKNVNYDSTVYTFKNKKTSEIVKMTRNEFIHRYNATSQNVYHLIKGSRKSVIGWSLVTV